MTNIAISMFDAENICKGINSKSFSNWKLDTDEPKKHIYDAGKVRFISTSRANRMQVEDGLWFKVKSCQIIWLSEFNWVLEVRLTDGITIKQIPILYK